MFYLLKVRSGVVSVVSVSHRPAGSMTMSDQVRLEGPHNTPLEGQDVTPKEDGGVLKVYLMHCA